ncbi:hypothetical protein G7Y89_g523 [Cudoniella acicularis]|uniref:Uncharacterized protein n=1 Tax=Cudoniella acicularis TaxID=354080 RepID=A0A8H4RXZ7_9HELO|nr:hypothetical protein G7Y89_g523 [Cudoniella acicularis]
MAVLVYVFGLAVFFKIGAASIEPQSASTGASITSQIATKTATTLSTAFSDAASSQASTISSASSSTTAQAPEITAPPVFQDSYPGISDDDLDCWKSYAFYTSRSSEIDYDNVGQKISTISSVIPVSSTSWWHTDEAWPAPTTTLCDGIPRATGSPILNSYMTTSTAYNITQYSYFYYPTTTQQYLPSPTCSIQNWGAACSNAFVTRASMIASIEALSLTTIWPGDDLEYISRVLAPPCETLDSYATTATKVTCGVNADTYSMLYWPVTLGGDFCANGTKSTILPAQTIAGAPNTVEVGDETLTSPSVYYALSNIQLRTLTGYSAGHGKWISYGDPIETATFTEAVDKISSLKVHCYGGRHGNVRHCDQTPYPMDFGDLATIGSAKYFSKYSWGSTTIHQDQWKPTVTYPPVGISSLWDICDTFETNYSIPTYITLPITETDDAAIRVAHASTTASTPSPTGILTRTSPVSVTKVVEVQVPSDSPKVKR